VPAPAPAPMPQPAKVAGPAPAVPKSRPAPVLSAPWWKGKPADECPAGVDRDAASHVFAFPEAPADATRVSLRLDGTWQVCAYDDPDVDVDSLEPVREIAPLAQAAGAALAWKGFAVPGSLRVRAGKKVTFPFGHRAFYRTKVSVPASCAGRAFRLEFAGTNWIASVFVNGNLAGTHKSANIPWHLDVSEHVIPGRDNEIAIAVKSPWYGFDTRYENVNAKKGPGSLKPFMKKTSLSRPHTVPFGGKGAANGNAWGIAYPVTLAAAGGAYVEDVFVKTSVAKKRLEYELTLRNASDVDRTLSVACEAVNQKTKRSEQSFGPVEVTVPARSAKAVTVSGAWDDPQLWWPEPKPNLYVMKTTVADGGRAVDVHEQLFGFREVTIDGTSFKLNGVRWNMWGWWGQTRRDLAGPEDYAAQLRKERTRFNRIFSHSTLARFFPTQEERLDFCDRNGIAGCQASMVEGMGVAYVLTTIAKEGGRWVMKPNEPVWRNFRRHMAQVARAYRNHPSVLMYSLENETIYINHNNFYGHIMWSGMKYEDYMEVGEREMARVAEAAKEFDDTKPYVVSGAGDLGGKLPMNTPHYPTGSLDWYPENAFTFERTKDHIRRWPWKRDKPWYAPEVTFARDLGLASYTVGDDAFTSQRASMRGKAEFLRMLFGNWRWAGVAGWSCCGNYASFERVQDVLSPLCVLPRKQTSRLYGGRENRLSFKVMNDTFSDRPVTFSWSYRAGGRVVASGEESLGIEPGFGEERTISITPPKVRARTDGVLTLTASQEGAETYRDERGIAVLPVITSLDVRGRVAVYDPRGKVTSFLESAGARVASMTGLDRVPKDARILVVGPDALDSKGAYGTSLATAARDGISVVVLEQDMAVAGVNVPARLTTTAHFGGYAHPQALGTKAFRDLGRDDLIDWAGEFPTYKNVYKKPAGGARSLVQCGEMLPYSALVEVPAGKGYLVLCQLRVGAKLGVDPAADILLRNLVETYAGASPSQKMASVVADDERPLANAVAKAGVLHERVASVANALDATSYRVAVVDATEANMSALGSARGAIERFVGAGGWVMVNGVGPKSMKAFNTLVGADHMLRPFRIERVTFQGAGQPLGTTIGTPDLGLLSTEHIQHGRIWPSMNTYSYVIDGIDAAPFSRPPGAPKDPFEYKPTRNDHDPYNYVNGLMNSLSWRCIRQIWWDDERNKELTLTFHLRRPDTIAQVNIWNNTNYSAVKDIAIVFDGKTAEAVSATLPNARELTAVKLPAPVDVERTVDIVFKTRYWRKDRHKLVGIDNVQFLRPSAPEGAVYLDNVGGLVAFPRGQGGIFLNQLKFMKDEPNARNVGKKLKVLAAILQNMGVGASGGEGLAGARVSYEPLDILEYCNQYRDERWVKKNVWFGAAGQHVGGLAVSGDGEMQLGGVQYRLPVFTTAPKQDCIMVGAEGVPGQFRDVAGIRVGKRCDALYVLHAANIVRPVTADERRRITARKRPFRLPTLATYVITYADGETHTVSVILEQHVDHWLQEKPKTLPGAGVAWERAIERAGKRGVLYTMRITNPRPDVEIATLDIRLARDSKKRPQKRGGVAVLAVSLGKVIK